MTGEGANAADPNSTSVKDSQEVTDSQEEQPEPPEQQEQQEQPNKAESFRRKREKARVLIDEAHFYDYDSLVSQPVISQDSNLSPSLLQLL